MTFQVFRSMASRSGPLLNPGAAPAMALALAVFSGAASMRCLDALLPALAHDFGCSIGSAGAVVSAYALSFSAFQLVHGPLGDKAGTYRIITIATCLSALAATACALAGSLVALVVARFIAGSFAAAISPLTLSWLSRLSRAPERSVALARMTGAAILGTTAGQVGGGVIGGWGGRSLVFGLLAALFTIAGVTLLAIAPAPSETSRQDTDASAHHRLRPGLLGLLRRPGVRLTLIAVGIECFAIYMSLAYVGGILQSRFSIGSAHAGWLVSAYGFGGLAFVLLARPLLARTLPETRAIAAGVILGTGFGSLALSASQAMAIFSLFVSGFGFLLLHNILQVSAATVAPDASGTSLSLFAAAASLSQALGAAVGGFVFDRIGPTLLCLISASILSILGGAIAYGQRNNADVLKGVCR